MRGRNDPCPCGSGKKYKKCHLLEAGEESGQPSEAAEEHQLDERLTGKIAQFASHTLGLDLMGIVDRWLGSDPEPQVAIPWLAYTYEHQDKTLAEWFVEARGTSLTTEETSWLEAQGRAWLSIWSCTSVEPPVISLADLLTGEKRDVYEVLGSKTIRPGARILTRVADYNGRSLLCGLYPASLTPLQADSVLQYVRKTLKFSKKPSVDSVRTFECASTLLDSWIRKVEAIRHAPLPRIQNTDGDPMVLVEEQFSLNVKREEVLERMRTHGLTEGDEGLFYVIRNGEREADVTLIASIEVGKTALEIHTNSVRRADSTKKLIQKALGPLVTVRGRQVMDPLSDPARRDFRPSAPEVLSPEETAQRAAIVRKAKEQFYSNWVDVPIPMLGDLTPRDAVRARAGKERVRLLLDNILAREMELPRDERYDIAPLYKALRMRPPR